MCLNEKGRKNATLFCFYILGYPGSGFRSVSVKGFLYQSKLLSELTDDPALFRQVISA